LPGASSISEECFWILPTRVRSFLSQFLSGAFLREFLLQEPRSAPTAYINSPFFCSNDGFLLGRPVCLSAGFSDPLLPDINLYETSPPRG